jgi:hypothetical protein
MLSFRALFVAVLSLAGLAAAKSSTRDSVLVVLEPRLHRDNFSTFFDGLEGTLRVCMPSVEIC